MSRVRSTSVLLHLMVVTLSLFATQATHAGESPTSCGSLENGFGPFDYRIERGHNLYLVESAHFTPAVEALLKGNAGYLGGDIDYTLRAFPNHHRALVASMKYAEKVRSPQPPNMRYTVECYFVRALRFRPDDVVARILFASYLDKLQRSSEAIAHLNMASEDASDNGFTQFNIGLVHVEAKRYELALKHAQRAQALGFTRPTLRQRLEQVGQWRDAAPPEPSVDPAPKAASSPALSR